MTSDRELDIVEELRFFAEAAETEGVVLTMLSGATFTEAANEIEQLRNRTSYRADFHDLAQVSDENYKNQNDLADEVKRLRSLIAAWADADDSDIDPLVFNECECDQRFCVAVRALRQEVGR